VKDVGRAQGLSDEQRERAVKMVLGRLDRYPSAYPACQALAPKLAVHAGQPMHAATLGGLLRALGVANVAGRTSAMRQHVQQMPAPSSPTLSAITTSQPPSSPPKRPPPGAVTSPPPSPDHPTGDPVENTRQLNTRPHQSGRPIRARPGAGCS
jgi:hypothetical protein